MLERNSVRHLIRALGLVLLGFALTLAGCLSSDVDVAVDPSITSAPSATPTPEVFIPRTQVVPNGAMISGHVLWGRAPVAGVRVELRTGAWADPAASEAIAQAVSDNEGAFELEAPPNGGEFGLVALWPDGAANTAPVTPVRIAANGPDVQVDAALARPLEWLEPASGATVETSTTLRWLAVPDAVTYHVWVTDAGTTALTFDVIVPATAGGNPGAVLTPLKPGRTYTWDIQALDTEGALLARLTGSLQTSGDAVPDACSGDGLSTYIDRANGYCFAYPASFTVRLNEAGNPFVTGPALDRNVEPLRAALLVEVVGAIHDKTLEEIVTDYLAQFDGMDVPAITRTATRLAGQPAELLEVVPGREGSRDVFMLYDGVVFHLIFTPSVRAFPQASSDVQTLSIAVVTTFSLVPATRGED